MLFPEAPLDAYRTDLARDRNREDFGGADTVWLLTAHCLSRLVRATALDLPALGNQCAGALRDFSEPPADDTPPTPESEIADLLLIVEGLQNLRDPVRGDGLSRGIRGMIRRMADHGALSMAYTTVALTRRLTFELSDRERGLLAAEQAMVARLLGDLDVAEELYRASESIGERASDLGLLARVYIGRGVLDRVRGNYPRSRIFFERALELSETVRDRELVRLANQGLTICHAMHGKHGRALEHGWATLQLADGDAGREAEALTNLAQICLMAGCPAAALRGYAAVLERATSPRVVLSALGGAALAAAQSGDRESLARAAAAIEERTRDQTFPYENAQALYHLAIASETIGDGRQCEDYLARTRQVAKARGFFELLHKTERSEVTKAATRPAASAHLTPSSETVVAELSRFDVGDGGVLVLSRRSRTASNPGLTG